MKDADHDSLRILNHFDIEELLRGRELKIVDLVRGAYEDFAAGRAVLPHSHFLTFGAASPDRIIALPAFLDRDPAIAGIKWVSSVPSNVARGLPRASAIIAVNDRETGRAIAVLEGSLINAKRTAGSATLAARHFCLDAKPREIALIGLGTINLETLIFISVQFPSIEVAHVHDVNKDRLRGFAEQCKQRVPGLRLQWQPSVRDALAAAPLVSLATTAMTPHIESLDGLSTDAVVLHISLRDFAPSAILAANNVVDDVSHACRARTSVHLASEITGNTEFMLPIVEAISRGRAQWARQRPTIFSPFGLGVLDLVVAGFVLEEARARQIGTVVRHFHPLGWPSL